MCGGCAATGYLSYEGYRLPASGGNCGCSTSESTDGPGHDEPYVPQPKGVYIVMFGDQENVLFVSVSRCRLMCPLWVVMVVRL